MIRSLWGKKIGMTQIFTSDSKVVPVTVVHIGNLVVLQRKTTGHDGYEAVQVGCPRQKYLKEAFSKEWLANKKKYFSFVRELRCMESDSFEIGALLSLEDIFQENVCVSITGNTIGKGFQGCVKRYGFTGGRGSHGDKLGRRPGSLSGLRTCGRVFKGKRMPGHMGNAAKTISNLVVMAYKPEEQIIIVKGSVPGKTGTLLSIEKCG